MRGKILAAKREAAGKKRIGIAGLKNKAALMKGLTGLTAEGFMVLLPACEVGYEAEMSQRDEARPSQRQRQRGAGHKGALPQVADKGVFIVFYFRI
jgi:hypothetical protein